LPKSWTEIAARCFKKPTTTACSLGLRVTHAGSVSIHPSRCPALATEGKFEKATKAKNNSMSLLIIFRLPFSQE
jgi:hypothetical protein